MNVIVFFLDHFFISIMIHYVLSNFFILFIIFDSEIHCILFQMTIAKTQPLSRGGLEVIGSLMNKDVRKFYIVYVVETPSYDSFQAQKLKPKTIKVQTKDENKMMISRTGVTSANVQVGRTKRRRESSSTSSSSSMPMEKEEECDDDDLLFSQIPQYCMKLEPKQAETRAETKERQRI